MAWKIALIVAVAALNVAAAEEKCISPEMSVSYRILDDEGNPVPDVQCRGWIRQFDAKGGGHSYSLVSDTNGVVTIAGKCSVSFTAFFTKSGFYMSHLEPCLDADGTGSAIRDGKWQPYGEMRTVVLKRIKNPVRLRDPDARCCHKYPESGEWVGFDLKIGDWVPPLGNGKCADMMVRYTREQRTDGYFKSLDVSFTNCPYAGVYLMKKDLYSEMDSVYTALTNGEYVSSLRYEFERTATGNHMIGELGREQYLVFRIRTKVDCDGKLVSAHYGRIMGDWRYVDKGGMLLGPVFFNPTPNDTNLEDAETARRSSQMWGTPSGVAQTEPFWTSSGFASLLSVGKAWVRE